MDYGIEINRQGVMTFNKTTLEGKLESDQESVKKFFTTTTDSSGKETVGFFNTLDDKVKQYTKYGGLLSNFDSGLTKESHNLEDARKKAQDSIDTKYNIMTKQFIAYDSMINRVNSSFSSLQMMIDAEANKK